MFYFTFSFSKQLISLLLEQSDALSKDHNLFYVAVEIGIQKKGIFDLERLNVTGWLTEWMNDCRNDWLTDWLADKRTDERTHLLTGSRLTDWPTGTDHPDFQHFACRNLLFLSIQPSLQTAKTHGPFTCLDSSLPISHMMVLADDARPLEIQTRQATGEAK